MFAGARAFSPARNPEAENVASTMAASSLRAARAQNSCILVEQLILHTFILSIAGFPSILQRGPLVEAVGEARLEARRRFCEEGAVEPQFYEAEAVESRF